MNSNQRLPCAKPYPELFLSPPPPLPYATAMPSITYSHGGDEFECRFSKVDRSKLYGRVGMEALDENEDTCHLVTLSSDGKTLIPSGGTAFGYLSPDGLWRKKADLLPFNLDGEELEPVSSTLKATTSLEETATIEEYLSHKFRLAYRVDGDMPEDLKGKLADGTIFKFPFSYRGGLNPDTGFLLQGKDETVWMIIGQPARISFVGFEAAVSRDVDEEGGEGDLDDLMDFGIM